MKGKYMKKDSGSMGIGALIIFIALILVAAIAAAVIIQTASKVRDDANHTSQRITEQFLGMFQVISISGNRTTLKNITVLTITTKVVSSADVDLRHIAISIHTPHKVSYLLMSGDVSPTDGYNQAVSKTTASNYSVYLPNKADGSPWNPPVSYDVASNDIVVFVINLHETGQELGGHVTFEIHFTNTYTGTDSKLTTTTPAGFENNQWVRIYPPE